MAVKSKTKTYKVWFDITTKSINQDWEFIPEKTSERGITYGSKNKNGYFLLGRIRNKITAEEYRIRVDNTDNDKIDIDFHKTPKSKPETNFPGHHPIQSTSDPHDFFVSLPDTTSAIFQGTIRERMKAWMYSKIIEDYEWPFDKI